MTNNAVFSTGQVKSNIHLTNATRLRWSNEAKIDAGFADENDLFILSNNTIMRFDDLSAENPLAQFYVPSALPSATDCKLALRFDRFEPGYILIGCSNVYLFIQAFTSSFLFIKQLNSTEIDTLQTTFGPLSKIGASWYDLCEGVPCLNFISDMKHYLIAKNHRKFIGYFRHSLLDCPVYQVLWFKYRAVLVVALSVTSIVIILVVLIYTRRNRKQNRFWAAESKYRNKTVFYDLVAPDKESIFT